jgi:hypothetical protein
MQRHLKEAWQKMQEEEVHPLILKIPARAFAYAQNKDFDVDQKVIDAFLQDPRCAFNYARLKKFNVDPKVIDTFIQIPNFAMFYARQKKFNVEQKVIDAFIKRPELAFEYAQSKNFNDIDQKVIDAFLQDHDYVVDHAFEYAKSKKFNVSPKVIDIIIKNPEDAFWYAKAKDFNVEKKVIDAIDIIPNKITNFNFVENRPELKNKFENIEHYQKWYGRPKRLAEEYNKLWGGLFFHSMKNEEQAQFTLEVKEDIEMCVSTFDSHTSLRERIVLVGRGPIRLLYDFDCHSSVGDNGLRYAKQNPVDEEDEESREERISKKWKDHIEQIGDKYYDEGFVRPSQVEWLFVTGTDTSTVEKVADTYNLPILSWEDMNEILKSHDQMGIEDLYDLIDLALKGEDPDLGHEREDLEYEPPVVKKPKLKDPDRGKGRKPRKPFKRQDKMKKIRLEEGVFQTQTMDEQEIQALYQTLKKSYEGATGSAWSYDKFLHRASNWLFYGSPEGFVAVRPQRSGPYKLVATAGQPLEILRGFKELNAEGVPIWGMVSADIQKMLQKAKYKTPPKIVIKQVMKKIPPSVFGGVTAELNKDGSVTIDYPDVGKATKYFIANKAYYEWAINNIELPGFVKKMIKLLTENKNVEVLNVDKMQRHLKETWQKMQEDKRFGVGKKCIHYRDI